MYILIFFYISILKYKVSYITAYTRALSAFFLTLCGMFATSAVACTGMLLGFIQNQRILRITNDLMMNKNRSSLTLKLKPLTYTLYILYW